MMEYAWQGFYESEHRARPAGDVCGWIYITIVEEFHVVPRCLRRLPSSPAQAVIRYRRPSGHSYHTQVEHSRAIAFASAAGRGSAGEDGAESLCHTNEQSVNKCVLEGTLEKIIKKTHLKKCKLYGMNPCLLHAPANLRGRKITK